MAEEVVNTKKSTIEFEIEGSLVDAIFSGDISKLVSNEFINWAGKRNQIL